MNIIEEQVKKRGRPKKVVETNSAQSHSDTHEFNSYSNNYDLTTAFSFNISKMYFAEQIQTLIADPIENNETLRHLSRQIYNSNGIVTNTIDYMTALPTLDRVLVSKGKDEEQNRNDKESVQQALDVIKDKEFIRDALNKGMIDGTAFYYCEIAKPMVDNTKFLSDYEVESICEINSLDFNISIISLPTDYCRICGIKNSSYVIAFDLKYFDNCDGEKLERKLKKYPKEIRDGYYEYIKVKNGNAWIILNNTKTIVHKIRSSKDEKWGRPLTLAAIPDILYSNYFVDTKRNVLQDINNNIFVQTFPEGKEKGTSALTGKQQEQQHNDVKNAIVHKNQRNAVSVVSVAAGTKLDKIKVDDSIFDEKNESSLRDDIATDLGFGASLLNASSSGNYSTQQNNLELVSAQIFSWIEQITYELNKVFNSHIVKDKNNRIEIVYLPITLVNRSKFVGYMKDLYLSGCGSLQAWISSTGMNIEAYLSLMNMEIEENWSEKYKPHATSFTMSNDTKGGRPENTDSTNSNTIQSKTSNSNAQPKPSTG